MATSEQAVIVDTSPVGSQSFMEATEALMERSASMDAPLAAAISCAENFSHLRKETLMPNTNAIMNSLPPFTSMETSEEIPCHKRFMASSVALDTADLSANFVNACTYKAPLVSTMLAKKKKKKKLSARRNGFPIRRNGKSSSRSDAKFRERRQALFKKAQELSVLCSAEVAAIIFSPSGEVSEFASSSMSHILERFQSFQPQMPSNNALLRDVKRWKREATFQTNGLKDLQDFQRFFSLLKNIPLSIDEVQSIDSMLTHILDKICNRKMELFDVETQKIVEKGELLCKENNMLNDKLMQIMSTKECVSNALSGWDELRYLQDSLSTSLQHGLLMWMLDHFGILKAA